MQYRLGLLTESEALQTRLLNGIVPPFEVLPSCAIAELLNTLRSDRIAAVLIDLESDTIEQAAKTIQVIRSADGESLLLALAHPRRGFSARLKALGADEVLPWNIEAAELFSSLQRC